MFRLGVHFVRSCLHLEGAPIAVGRNEAYLRHRFRLNGTLTSRSPLSHVPEELWAGVP